VIAFDIRTSDSASSFAVSAKGGAFVPIDL